MRLQKYGRSIRNRSDTLECGGLVPLGLSARMARRQSDQSGARPQIREW